MQQQANKLLPTMINFHETYELMKSYLAKKRFSYVYEECIKYYNKNHTFFSNHEVLLMIKLVFYVLKKKMMAKFVGNAKKTWIVEPVFQIYNVMTNVYMSWESALMVQMNVEDPTFFDMIHHSNQFRKGKGSMLKSQRPGNLLFETKRDFLVAKKINIEHNIHMFFKQCLRMIINSLTVMISTADSSKVQRMISTLKLSDSLMSHFEQHHFTAQKIHFYILKCQILQQTRAPGSQMPEMKYKLPTGLFQMIYRNIYKWKEAKTCHYVQLLFRMIIVSMKNQMISIEDAYVLGNEIKLLVFTMKRKDVQVVERRSLARGRRSAVEFKNQAISQVGSKKPQSRDTTQPKQPQKHQSTSQTRWKAKCFNTLKTILAQIQTYINTRKQIAHILRVYMEGVYCMYKQNPTDKNDELIDQIPVLVEKENKKARKQRGQSSSGQKEEFGNGKQYAKKGLTTSETFRKEGYHEDEHGYEASAGHGQAVKKKENKIILKNILNVKNKKVLSLSKRNSHEEKFMNKSQPTQANTTFQAQTHQQSKQKFPFTEFISSLVTSSFTQLKAFQPSTRQALNLLEQSDSDSDNQLQYEFEMKRRNIIQDLNNRFYKNSNPNYREKEEEEEKEEDGDEGWSGEVDGDREGLEEVVVAGKKKVSDDLEFDEIRLLDDVIKEKIFGYLDLELTGTMKDPEPNPSTSPDATTNNSSKSPTTNNPPPITPYSTALKQTQTLKSQVQQLNKRRKLIIDKLKYKTYSIKTYHKCHSDPQHQSNSISSALKDLQNIYNTKNNLTSKAEECITLYRTLLKLDQIQQTTRKSLFNRTVRKYGKVYRNYNRDLSMIGEQDEDDDLTHRPNDEIPIFEYIVKNRPVSLLEHTLKRKELQSRFKGSSRMELLSEEKKQIALRDTFDNLRMNISKTQFNQTNSLTKNFSLKVPNLQ